MKLSGLLHKPVSLHPGMAKIILKCGSNDCVVGYQEIKGMHRVILLRVDHKFYGLISFDSSTNLMASLRSGGLPNVYPVSIKIVAQHFNDLKSHTKIIDKGAYKEFKEYLFTEVL